MSMTMPEPETDGNIEQITKKKLIEDLKTVVNDAEGLLKKAASDQTREWIRSAQSKAKKSLKAASDWLTEEEEATIARTKSAAKATEDYVRANTWMVLGMAAIAGLFVGILAVRRGLFFIKAKEKAGDSR
jgi:ElaB/YqjD/DUF883 family membrane-anchored ribosome-binding protein